MVNIGSVTSEITRAKIEIFATPAQRTGQKLAYPSKYWSILTKISPLVDVCMGIIMLTKVCNSPRTLLW